MGYLGIHNNTISGNTFRIYLSDYGRNLLSRGKGIYNNIAKFGLSDLDIDYRKFAPTGTCRTQLGLSALTGSCFYDLPDLRGVPTTISADCGTNPAVMIGPRCDYVSGVYTQYQTSIGSNPIRSSLWANCGNTTQAKVSNPEIDSPKASIQSSCWSYGNSVQNLYPSYCFTCADFNNDGKVDINDLKTFIGLLGTKLDNQLELIGDFNGDGVVDNKDLDSFLRCMRHSVNKDILNYCDDKEVFCALCHHLGNKSPCNGDCITCI